MCYEFQGKSSIYYFYHILAKCFEVQETEKCLCGKAYMHTKL